MSSYFGSKATSGLCQPIIAMMPPHDTYIETHLGGGAIMRRKPPALHNIAIDLDPEALRTFECDYPVEKVHGCAHEFLSTYRFANRIRFPSGGCEYSRNSTHGSGSTSERFWFARRVRAEA